MFSAVDALSWAGAAAGRSMNAAVASTTERERGPTMVQAINLFRFER